MTPDNITIANVCDFGTKLDVAFRSIRSLRIAIERGDVGPHEASAEINDTLAELARAAGFDVEFTKSEMILTNQP